MGDDANKDLITYNPLREETRKERTALLGLAALALAIVEIPMVPAKFSAFGIELSSFEQTKFVQMLALVLFYYFCAFSIYALSDYVAWRRNEVIVYQAYVRAHAGLKHATQDSLQELIKDELRNSKGMNYRGVRNYWFAFGVVRIRAAFEFLMPIGFALFTLARLHHFITR